jgi:CheY-like chemotaxis protein
MGVFNRVGFLLRRGRIVKISLLDSLSRHMPFSTLEQLALGGEDWRSLVARAAKNLEVPEEALLEKIARTMRLPVLQRVRPIDPLVMEHVPDLTTLRYNATIPLVSEGIVAGYACVDPNRTLDLVEDVERTQLHLASWTKIEKALEESEAIFAAERKRLKGYQKEVIRKKALSALEQIVLEAQRYESRSLLIRIAADAMSYEFILPDGRRGKGTILDAVRGELISILNDAAAHNAPLFEGDTGEQIGISVESPYECFRLSWGSEDAESAPEESTEQENINGLSLCAPEPAPVVDWCGECSILVLEDNQSFTRVLDCFLKKHDFEVRFTADGNEGLAALKAGFAPDVIVCDVHMPEMNGHEFIKRLRSIDEFSLKPVIMLTSDQDIETELTFVSYGVDAFLAKSDDPRLLIGHIKRIMARESAGAEGNKKAA